MGRIHYEKLMESKSSSIKGRDLTPGIKPTLGPNPSEAGLFRLVQLLTIAGNFSIFKSHKVKRKKG